MAKWIVIYGKGPGKDLWVSKAEEKLGNPVRLFYEPSSGPVGSTFRRLMKRDRRPHSKCLKFLLISDKYYQVYEQILPLLDSDVNVVCSWKFVWKGEDKPNAEFFYPDDEGKFEEWLASE